MSFFSDLFSLSPISQISKAVGGGGDSKGVDVVADPYGDTRGNLLKWLNGQIGQTGKKYTGEMVAPQSNQENQSFDFLRQYGENLPGETFNNAKTEINKTLTNQYDPTTSPYYQAVKAEAARNQDITNKQIASNTSGAGRYYTGARVKQQREASTDTTNRINTIMGGLADSERNRMMGVLPQAEEMGKYEANMPLQKATAFQTLGALPRNIQQAKDQAQMEDWLRSEVNYPFQIGQLASNVQTPPTYQQKPPSMMDQLMGGVSSALPYLMMAML